MAKCKSKIISEESDIGRLGKHKTKKRNKGRKGLLKKVKASNMADIGRSGRCKTKNKLRAEKGSCWEHQDIKYGNRKYTNARG